MKRLINIFVMLIVILATITPIANSVSRIGGEQPASPNDSVITIPTTDLTANGTKVNYTVANNSFGIFAVLTPDPATGTLVPALADSVTHVPVAGMALSATNGLTSVLTYGFVRNNAWTWGTTPADSKFLYLDASTAGDLTQTVPSGSGNQLVAVAEVWGATLIRFYPSLATGEK